MIETLALIGLAYALVVGLFGIAGMAFFWLVFFAAAFLLAGAIALIEILAARLADVWRAARRVFEVAS